MNSDRPRAPFFMSGSVRSSTASTFARPANVHQALAPLIRYPLAPPTSAVSARHFTEATSEPMSGSVTEMPTMISPAAIGGSHFCFCSSVPPLSSALVRISGRVIRLPAAASEQRDSSSVVMIMARLPMPPPPYSSGTAIPKKPSSAIFRMSASGTRSSLRWMCSAIGETSASANWRTESRVMTAISSPIHE